MKLSRWSAALLALAFLYFVRDILPPFVIALALAYILVPIIDAVATRLRVRRWLIIAGFYVLLLITVGTLIRFIEHPLSVEIQALTRNRTEMIRNTLQQVLGPAGVTVLGMDLQPEPLAAAASNGMGNVLQEPADALRLAERIVSNILKIFLTLIVLFYLLLDWEKLGEFVRRFVPLESRPRFEVVTRDIHRVLGHYLRGQLLLIVLVSVVTWVFLRFVFHVRYALLLSLATGFLEIIPLLGPIVAATIAAFVAAAEGGLRLALIVIVFYTVLRQVEDQLVMPNVVGKAVHLHPVITLFAVLAGEALWGVLGALLAVPVAAAVKVVFDYVQPARAAPPPTVVASAPSPPIAHSPPSEAR